MAETATLQGKVTLDAGGWYRGLRGIKASLSGYGKTMGEAFGKLRTGAMLAGAAAIAGLGVAANAAQRYGDEIAKAHYATGKSTEELSGLRYAAEASALAWNDLLAAIMKANKTRPDKSIEQIADELVNIENPAERARIAMDIFGKELALKVLPLLNQGSKGIEALKARAADLGLIISLEQAQSAERLGDAMTDLKLSFFGAARSAMDFGNVTNILERATGAVVAFRKSATFNTLRQSVADTANQFLDMGARILATWESLEGGTKSALLSIGGTLAGFGALWYLGLVQPIVGGIAKALFATGTGLSAMGVLITGFGAAVLGYKIGKALDAAFDLGQVFAKLNLDLKYAVMEFTGELDFLVKASEWYWKSLKGVFAGDMPDWEGFKEIAVVADETRKDLAAELERMQLELAKFAEPGVSLADAFKKEFSLEQFKKDLAGAGELIKGLLPEATQNALDDLLKKWQAAAGVKFPALPVNAAAKGAADDAERELEARKKLRDAEAPFRGGYINPLTGKQFDPLKIKPMVPKAPEPLGFEGQRLAAIQQKQLDAAKAQQAALEAMNANRVTIGIWQY